MKDVLEPSRHGGSQRDWGGPDRATQFAPGAFGSQVAVRGMSRGLNHSLLWPVVRHTYRGEG
eukprot:3647467-Alexandrium_andersonii.AAC.1